MRGVSADWTEPEGESLGPQNMEALEAYAQNMAENIIQPLISQMEEVEPAQYRCNQEQEMFAEELASVVMALALRDVLSVECSGSAGVKMESETGGKHSLDMDTQMDPVKDVHHPPLSQSGLPIAGSLDYPDAPPTTPLLPELERSRHSFARKLKGGLAKVFLPSPPPPTPKETENSSGCTIGDPRVELMEHLMQSLSTDDLEVGCQLRGGVEAFAEVLSCDIMEWVLREENRELMEKDADLHVLAHQLAETIITSSLDEAKRLE
ncbi:uncharacterized protein LOC114436558 [Parambassis ranga]|uniref:Uncharacterized protein LOC114436558 n=1 Tax=Parambassis ranga TaxID=210632 RepID=A0A6P7IPV4_9TELE|nr:uncharacterized protein LOC114436558 [Parambassis ranga]